MRQLFLLFILLFVSCQRYPGPPECVAMYNAVEAYGEAIAKQYNMKLLLIEPLGYSMKATCNMAFIADKTMTLDESRLFFESIVDNLIHFLETSPAVRRYVAAGNEPPGRESTAVRIAFWDPSRSRIMPPSIAEMHYYEGTFYYYTADPITQSLHLELKQPWQ